MPNVSQFSMATALCMTGKYCRGWWKLPNSSPVPHSPPSRPSRASDACIRRAASSKTVLTPATVCSPHSRPGGVSGLSAPVPAGSEEASFLQLSPYWTLALHPSDNCTLQNDNKVESNLIYVWYWATTYTVTTATYSGHTPVITFEPFKVESCVKCPWTQQRVPSSLVMVWPVPYA